MNSRLTDGPVLDARTHGGFRDGLNRHRRLALAIAAFAILASAAWIVWTQRPVRRDLPPPRTAFYTVDDGATLFVDDAERLPPFDHGGKPAVRAIVYSCDGGKTRFVGWLQKLPEDALRKALAAARDSKAEDDDDIAAKSGWLVKKPGDAQWVNSKADLARYYQIVAHVKCPTGDATPMRISPDPKRK
ncbi:MAG TPA: hypothetical protein VFC78_13990 [Tepidisphaeraceae bacterium]|nr:hypothetical protein [Tepidisphaeraceae bacterium]